MNADGTVLSNLTNMDLSGERQPTWQPIIVADPTDPPAQPATPAPAPTEESKSIKFTNPKLKAKRTKIKKRCYRLVRERTPCKRTSSKGFSQRTSGSTSSGTYKPLGKSMRSIRRLKKGKKIPKGLYYLTIKAKLKTGGAYEKFTYKLRVK